MELLEYVLSDFWIFVGSLILLSTIGAALIGIARGIGKFRFVEVKK